MAEEADSKLLARCSLDIRLLPESAQDVQMAALMRLQCSRTLAEQEKNKLNDIMNRPLLVNSATTTAASVAEARVEKAFAQRLHKSDLGIVARGIVGKDVANVAEEEADRNDCVGTSEVVVAGGSGSDKVTTTVKGLVSADYLSTSEEDSDN